MFMVMTMNVKTVIEATTVVSLVNIDGSLVGEA